MKIAYIDHISHKQTGSTEFFTKLLDKNFEVKKYWHNGRSFTKILKKIKMSNFDVVIFFQYLPNFCELRKLNSKIVYIPMYDYSVVWQTNFFWWCLSKMSVSIISFSTTLGSIINEFNFRSIIVQYFPDQEKKIVLPEFSEIKVFFWDRGGWSLRFISKFIAKNYISSFIYKGNSKNKLFRITANFKHIANNDNKEAYLNSLNESNVFFATRDYEGIGMSFLEAMQKGMIVISKDNPTMNEYIVNGFNGFLLKNEEVILILKKTKLKEISFNASHSIYNGKKKWSTDSIRIITFIKTIPENKVSFLAWQCIISTFFNRCFAIIHYLIILFKSKVKI